MELARRIFPPLDFADGFLSREWKLLFGSKTAYLADLRQKPRAADTSKEYG